MFFRYKHVQIRTNAEALAFFWAGPLEGTKAQEKLQDLLKAQQKLVLCQAVIKRELTYTL